MDETTIKLQFEKRGKSIGGKEKDFKNAIENAKVNVLWVKEKGSCVSEWLKKEMEYSKSKKFNLQNLSNFTAFCFVYFKFFLLMIYFDLFSIDKLFLS